MTKVIKNIESRFERGEISLTELEFSRFLTRMDPDVKVEVVELGMRCFRSFQEGNICIRLSEDELSLINESNLIGAPGAKTIFTREDDRLYLQKYWKYEEELAKWLLKKTEVLHELSNEHIAFVKELFDNSEETDWQKIAVKLSLLKNLTILTGGPGTGKTYTIQKIIEAHRFQNPHINIQLAAPTGKAAQRLADSFQVDEMPKPQTIHSLLGARMNGDGFRYNRDNPLNVDLLIIDEASMLDIQLWTALIRGLSENTKLVLVGDPHQLASVEAGSVLGDICKNATNKFSKQLSSRLGIDSFDLHESKLNECMVSLEKNRRFDEHSAIDLISTAIKNGESESVIAILEDKNSTEVSWVEPSNESIKELVRNFIVAPFETILDADSRTKEFNRYQVLTPLRKGLFGSERINDLGEKAIKEASGINRNQEWFDGRAVIATRNQYSIGVQNGEIGIYDSRSEMIDFEGREERKISANRIPNIEPAQCLTIHKSQGSEFEHVAIILPNASKTLLTKELLYTAVTRARQSILVVGNRKTIIDTVNQSIHRTSGLTKKIWERS